MAEVTIKTIAKEAGVSISLVSQVLNDRPVRVSPETRERIKRVASEMHYVPNMLASCLKSKQTKTIALLAPFTPFGFFSNLIYNVQKYARQAGYLTIVVNTFENEEHEAEELALYQSGMFDGMLIAPLAQSHSEQLFAQMKNEKYPFVFVDRFNPSCLTPIVSSDHEKIGYDMTMKAVGEGKKDIVFAYREGGDNSAGDLRLAGYKRAMIDSGLEPHCVLFSYHNDRSDKDSMRKAVSSLEKEPDVLFIHSGYYLPLLASACVSYGFDLKKISFMMVDGFAFTEAAADMAELLFAISGRCLIAVQDIDMIAKHAVSLLLSQIKGESQYGSKVLIPSQYQSF
jgi:DNA-binding LacI/PurR family transcriptional regulator